MGIVPIVITVDQRDSRRAPDLVPGMLAALADVPLLRPFQRTAGDEFQGLLDDAQALPGLVEQLLRDGHWAIGIGVGPLDGPLPLEARDGRGLAYVRARDAVESAKQAVWPVRVVGPDGADALESALWLWAALLARRTSKGWEVADLVDRGLSYEKVAEKLAITQSAVSQRARAAGLVEGARARTLVARLGAACLAAG